MLCVAVAEPLAAELFGLARLHSMNTLYDSTTPIDLAPFNSWFAAFILSVVAVMLIGQQGALPRQEAAKIEEQALRRLASKIGWKAGVLAWPICTIVMMLRGDPFLVSGAVSVLAAPVVGLLAWALVGSFGALKLPH
jgi:hypothetical protein